MAAFIGAGILDTEINILVLLPQLVERSLPLSGVLAPRGEDPELRLCFMRQHA